ncbi:MAG: DUF2530 domain-containing protein [Microbacteriaceae bacterium]
MRLWLKDSERRPDPAPAKTDDRLAIFVGLGAWILALITVVIVAQPFSGNAILGWTCVVGIALGIAGLFYTQARHRKAS